MSDPISQLPPIYRALIPELAEVRAPIERLATCTACAMAPKPGQDPDKPIAFTAAARCCTYNPSIPNHAVGRILRRNDVGSERMRARIASGHGVGPEGVLPTPEDQEKYRAVAGVSFGRTLEITCPYWVEEEHGCTIWADRNAVCRTWFCKYEAGPRGRVFWHHLKTMLEWVEWRIANTCISLGTPPAGNATAHEWMAWYRWCAERADLLEPSELAELRNNESVRRRDKLVGFDIGEQPIPDVVVPCLETWHRIGAQILASSYSVYHLTELPPWIFELLARLDGVRTWQVAVAELEVARGEPVDPGLIAMMWARGLVIEPLPEGAFVPGGMNVGFPEGYSPEMTERILKAMIPDTG